jgi:hypothetical protein
MKVAVEDLKRGDEIALRGSPYADPNGNLPEFHTTSQVTGVRPDTENCTTLFVHPGNPLGYGFPRGCLLDIVNSTISPP